MSDAPATTTAPVDNAPESSAPVTGGPETTKEAPAAPEAADPTTTTPAVKSDETPATASAPVEDKSEVPAAAAAAAAAPPATTEAAPATDAPAAETKPTEPLTEGHLGYKAPGLLKQFTYAKKDFWFSEEPVAPQKLDLYMRGEKAEISHPVVAWASQTGKGLLFFNKKGESAKTHPAGVIPLYDASDLKKTAPHEFSFRLHGQQHSFKASSEAERNGWFSSIESAVELGKSSKASVRDSEAYKSEIKKLNTPNTIAGAGLVKKSADADKTDGAKRVGSTEGDEADAKKNKGKSRSTSRGVLNRFKAKKEELEEKQEEKKEEKEETKPEEKKIEEPAEPAPAAAEPAAAAAAPVEDKKDESSQAAPVAGAAATTAAAAEEKPKPTKRGSIFGKFGAGFKSPTKEKDQKDAELKPEVPPKDTGVSENPPQLPETAQPEAIDPAAVAAPATEAKAGPTEPAAETAKETPEVLTPSGKEKKNFLSGLPFINKRDRSVSPSHAMKDTPAKTETPAATEATEPAAEPTKPAEPATETATPAATETTAATETPAATEAPAATETPAKAEGKAEEASPAPNKRQSVLGSLSRRASKAIHRFQPPKKENTAPEAAATAPAKAEETATEATAPTAAKEAEPETAAAPAIEPVAENKPEAIASASPPAVTASA